MYSKELPSEIARNKLLFPDGNQIWWEFEIAGGVVIGIEDEVAVNDMVVILQ